MVLLPTVVLRMPQMEAIVALKHERGDCKNVQQSSAEGDRGSIDVDNLSSSSHTASWTLDIV